MAIPSGAKAIGRLQVGEQVSAHDPATGHAESQAVQHVWINHDYDQLDVTLHADPAPTQDATA